MSPAYSLSEGLPGTHRFATERTVSIETTQAGGNANFLSLREQT
jgi:delta 1-pyrroline-5-carboxylate dehydrogenase